MPKFLGFLESEEGPQIVNFWANLVEFLVQEGHSLFVPVRHSTVNSGIIFANELPQ